MEITSQAWIRQPLALLCKQGGISKPAAIVLALIIDGATNTDPPSPINAKLDAMAERSGYSISSVKRAIAELIGAGLIESHRTGRGSVYTLTGAVELLPPKGREQQNKQNKQNKRKSESERDRQKRENYMSLVNSFTRSAPLEVCEQAAPEGDPDYEL